MKKATLLMTLACVLLDMSAASDPVKFSGVDTFGSLIGPDGSDWFFTQNFIPSTEFDFYYAGSDITLYDNEMDQVMTIHYQVPAGVRTNSIEPFGQVTQKFFDYKEGTYEVMLYVHSLGAYDEKTSSYEQIHENYVYSGEYESEATQIFKYDCQNMKIIDASRGFDVSQRLCTLDQVGDSVVANLYTRGRWSSTGASTPVLSHTFKLPFANVNYVDGSWFNSYVLDGEYYYVLSYYEKPYTTGFDENYDIIRTPNNYFIAEVYDQNYDCVQKVRVSANPKLTSPFTFHSVGRFDKNLTRGYFTGDDQLNLVIGFNNYIISRDESEYDFRVYDQQGALVKTIFEGASTWNFLHDLPGHECQVGLLRQADDETSEIAMINLPSCTEEVVLPSVIESHKLNWNFDRVAVSADDYNYVFALNEGVTDKTTQEDLGLIGWYTRAGQQVRIDSLSIGTNGQMFKPLLSEDYPLSAYVFNNDDLLEYSYLAKRTKKNSTAVETSVRIGNQLGQVVYEFKSPSGFSLSNAGFLNYNSSHPQMAVISVNNSTQKYDIDIYSLPFTTFEGEGTESNPYIISTVGDLAQISAQGNGHYVIVNDLDMSTLGRTYCPPVNFCGSVDGQGHTISNLYLQAGAYNQGLFGTVIKSSEYDQSRLSNITLLSPRIETGEMTQHAGFLVGWGQAVDVSGCYVCDGRLESPQTGVTAGGIVGQMGTQSSISGCGVYRTTFDAARSSVGGIVGKAIFNSSVIASAVTDCTIVGGTSVGGIMGEAEDATSAVSNCHVRADISGKNAVGGVVGSSARSECTYNFIELQGLSAELDDRDATYQAGGVIGHIDTKWESGTNTIIITGNVVVPAEGASEDVWESISGKNAWHRIIGFTAQDETYESNETHKSERGASQNYAASQIPANGSKGSTTPDGLDLSGESINQAFFKDLGYHYGENTSSPWKDNDGRPRLYFEEATGATGIETVASESKPASPDGIYYVDGRKAGSMVRRGLYISNGKKIVRF